LKIEIESGPYLQPCSSYFNKEGHYSVWRLDLLAETSKHPTTLLNRDWI